MTSGFIGYISSNNVVSPALATGITAAYAVGLYTGTVGQLQQNGQGVGQFDAAASPVAGQPCWVSLTNAGEFTAVGPTGSGNVVTFMGIIMVGGAGGTGTTGQVALSIQAPIQL